jgi:hypothetical protein
MKNTRRAAMIATVFALTATGAYAQTNRVLYLDGVNDYLSLSRPVADSFTIEFWMNPSAPGTSNATWYLSTAIIDNSWDHGVQDYGIYLDSLRPGFATDNNRIATSSMDASVGQWTHFAFSRDKTTGICKVFLNGTAVGEGTGSTASLTTQVTTWIGWGHWLSHDGLNRRFSGYLDEVRFWNRVLSVAEIQTNMFRTLTGSESGLVTYFNFDANNFNDKTTLSNHATAYGSPAIILTNVYNVAPTIFAAEVADVMGVQFGTTAGLWYSLQFSTNLISTSWTDTGLRVLGDGTSRWFFDPAGFTPVKFYKVRQE